MASRVVMGVLAVALVIGMKFFNKSSDSSEVKAHLVKLCEGDSACVKAVETHFDGCFESSYKMGGRRTAARLEADQLVQCLNRKAGEPYFSASGK
jgi:hypothetical protein